MRGEKSRRGRRSTTKKGRTAVWDIGRRRSLLHRWGRLSPATLCWLRRPQPQTRSRKVSYDLVREERGQVIGKITFSAVSGTVVIDVFSFLDFSGYRAFIKSTGK